MSREQVRPLPQTLRRRLAWLSRHPTSSINYGTDNQLARLGLVHVDHCAGLTQLDRKEARRMKLAIIILLGLACASCASIVDNGPDFVAFNSTPEGATVIVDNIPVGKTPCTAPVSRRWCSGDVTFRLHGYPAIKTGVGRTINPWVFGNIIFGGLIGVCVDCATGNCRRTGKYIQVHFEKRWIDRPSRKKGRVLRERLKGCPGKEVPPEHAPPLPASVIAASI